MELHVESNPALNTITAYGEDFIEINRTRYHHAVCFGPESEIRAWDIETAEGISAAALRELAGLREAPADPMAFLEDTAPGLEKPTDAPEVVIIGTGSRQTLLPIEVTADLMRVGIGVESMSTQAASRTYNILMAEGRRVIVALLPPEEHE